MIDLRSDTVTKPTPAMRAAMAAAEVGDDVYREDPTVNRLEQRAAEVFAKEAALFVPTGTMGNTIAVKMHTRHGEEVLCESRSHLLDWELSMTAWFSGCLVRTIDTEDGLLTWKSIEPRLRVFGPHNAPTTLIELENTHNMAGGTVYPQDQLDEICHRAHERGIRVHMDGARIFNAAAAYRVHVSELVKGADSVTFCLSKGLCAPAGSIIVGSKAFIDEARRKRKMLGGGMRQVGVLAAAGSIALHEMSQRLHEDHANAALLAEGISDVPHLRVLSQNTNFVFFYLDEAAPLQPEAFEAALRERGIYISGYPGDVRRYRLVTHYWITRDRVDTVVQAMKELLTENVTQRA